MTVNGPLGLPIRTAYRGCASTPADAPSKGNANVFECNRPSGVVGGWRRLFDLDLGSNFEDGYTR